MRDKYNVRKYNIVSYIKKNGKCPINDLLDTITKYDNASVEKITQYIEYLTYYGRELGEPKSKPIKNGQGLYELRPGRYRIMYFFYDENTIVVTNGFIKKSKAEQNREIEQAKKYKKDYMERETRK